MQGIDTHRRRLLQWLGTAGGLLALGRAGAHHTDTHFADKSEHQIVYQCNKADHDYLSHILFSVGELIRRYGDDVEIVVACFGPGIHLLGDPPEREVAKELRERASSLNAYGVRFHACKNTMDSLGWTEENLVDYAVVVPVGVEDIMLLQEKGFSYVSW
ncbi:MAG: DsrE family protein [Gammaproteobacteria bacterium]|nr:DsrE family protein [Gammaproteobacteria bacterium]